MTNDAIRQAHAITNSAGLRAEASLKAMRSEMEALEGEYIKLMGEMSHYKDIDSKEAMDFLKEPWCIHPRGKEEWLIFVPKFIGVQVGWLERTTETFNVFVVNRYAHWLGNIPPDLRDELKLPPPFESSFEGHTLRTKVVLPRDVKEHVAEKTGPDEYRVKIGHEFDLIASLIDNGSLPFVQRPVDKADLRDIKFAYRGQPTALRDYQETGWKEFLKWGRVGIYWPWGTGKSVLGIYAIGRVIGRKLIVCPTTTLVEHWTKEINQNLPLSLRTGDEQIDVITYQAFEKVKKNEYALVIFDECHRLPANTFSRMCTVRAKYGIGLSATPQREDGRTHYIFALTGKPVGCDWTEFFRQGIITKPHVEVRIMRDWNTKMAEAQREAEKTKGRVMIFCDGIERGAQLANRLGCPHIHGESGRRLETMTTNRVFVVSRVGDEGVSLPDLKKVIEVDFLGASRRQEGQRVGRLMHAQGKGEHIVLMTRDEFESFEGRFFALEEKGFKVNVVTR
jgi:DNA excision repair protein ERCC-3